MAQSKRWEGSKVAERSGATARREGWESNEVASWEILCFIQGWGTPGETKIFARYLPKIF